MYHLNTNMMPVHAAADAQRAVTPPRAGAGARRRWRCCALAAFAGFVALGIWQVERGPGSRPDRARRARVHAAPRRRPGPRWPRSARPATNTAACASPALPARAETLVRPSTELGAGYWVLTPLRTADGTIVLVNRGFVPPEPRDPPHARAGKPAGRSTVRPAAHQRARRRLPAPQRSGRRPLVLARRRGDRRGARPRTASRPTSSMPRRRAPTPPQAAPVGGLTVVHSATTTSSMR